MTMEAGINIKLKTITYVKEQPITEGSLVVQIYNINAKRSLSLQK